MCIHSETTHYWTYCLNLYPSWRNLKNGRAKSIKSIDKKKKDMSGEQCLWWKGNHAHRTHQQLTIMRTSILTNCIPPIWTMGNHVNSVFFISSEILVCFRMAEESPSHTLMGYKKDSSKIWNECYKHIANIIAIFKKKTKNTALHYCCHW